MTRATLLIVEDEAAIRQLLTLTLAGEPYHLLESATLQEARAQLARQPVHLVILDWMLPDGNGTDLLPELRERRIATLMLTARSTEADIIRGLTQGADDYLTKPFSLGELKARLQALLRRLPPASMAEDGIHLDSDAQQAYYRNQPVTLHRREYHLLRLLLEQPGKVHSREQLLDAIWGNYSDINDRTVDVAIRRLRKAFAEHGYELPITTVRGSGYRLDKPGDM